MLYHLLPVVFWLLALGSSAMPVLWSIMDSDFQLSTGYYWGFAVALVVLLCEWIIRRIPRHSESIEQCFQVALLLGIASYGLPTVCFLMVLVWINLIYRNLFSFRALLSSLIGFAVVALWAVVLDRVGMLRYPLSLAYNLWAWLPTGSFLVASVASSYVIRTLRMR